MKFIRFKDYSNHDKLLNVDNIMEIIPNGTYTRIIFVNGSWKDYGVKYEDVIATLAEEVKEV